MNIEKVNSNSQIMPKFAQITSLPGGEGWSGMYAGTINGMLLCFGGVNFPDKRPWEGGKKKWYDDIYMLQEGLKDLEEVSKKEWEAAQNINSTGMILLTQAVIKLMRKQRSGNIINIGSIQGSVGPNFPVYGNTGMTSPINYTYDKWAMVGFTKWIANYYGKFNIRANCISPGGYGPGVAKMIGKNEFVENYKRLTPLGRFADDEDIKGPVVFLASEASAFITGHNLLVDGGWTSW